MAQTNHPKRFISVGTKLALATLVVLTGLSSLLYKELTQRERKHLIDAKAIAGSMVTDLFATSCAAPLVFADNDAVATELEKLKGNKAIVYAAVYSNNEKKIVGEFNPRQQPSFDFRDGQMASQRTILPDRIIITKEILDTKEKVIGHAVLYFSLEKENLAFQVSRRRMLWFAFFLAAGTTTLLILLARKVIVRPLSRVTEAARKLEQGDLHARAEVRSSDEVGKLAFVFNSMGDAIVDREQKVIQAQKNVQDLFDNMLQAIFTVGPDGRINSEVSAYAKQIFGDVPIAGEPVMKFLQLESRAQEEAVSRMNYTLQLIFGADDFQWLLSEPDRIREIRYMRKNPDGKLEERILELDYAPLYKEGLIVKIMFLIKDITEIRRLQEEIERRDQQNKENLARIRQIASIEPDLFNTFITEAYSVLDGCENSLADLLDPSRRADAVNSLFRGMHTLKGNARMVKLTAVQDIAHQTEDYFQKVRDGQVGLDDDIGAAMNERISEVRKLLREFEKLGRQVLGGEQETPAEAALAFLRTYETTFEAWKPQLALLESDEAGQARDTLAEHATQLHKVLITHGFITATKSCEHLAQEIAKPTTTPARLATLQQNLMDDLQITRALAAETAKAELWPYFHDEAKAILRSCAGKIAKGEAMHDEPPIDLTSGLCTLTDSARAFELATLANISAENRRRVVEEGLEPRSAINAMEGWIADCRNLVEMASHPEIEVNLLERFTEEAAELAEQLDSALGPQIPTLVAQVRASARRYRFQAVEQAFHAFAKQHPLEPKKLAIELRQLSSAYQKVRQEIQNNEEAEHLLLVMPVTSATSESEISEWLTSATEAGLKHLTELANRMPPAPRALLPEDIRHFQVVIPAFRGSKTGQSVQRVLEARISALRESLRVLRSAVTHARTDSKAILPRLKEMEKAVIHLTTSSLGDVLAPVVSSGMELARERGKQLEEISLEHLEFFLDAKVMQKIRGAVVHAIRNAVDHGLEPSEVRLAAGKTPCCRVAISAQEQAGWIELSIQDDGRGIDTDRVKEIALKKGLISAEHAPNLSQDEIFDLLFLPGFSTASNITSVSGRGVGMDAIREIAKEIGGEVKLSSKPGQGTKVVLRFPANATLPDVPMKAFSREILIKSTAQHVAIAN